jgi:hypothetical protein
MRTDGDIWDVVVVVVVGGGGCGGGGGGGGDGVSQYLWESAVDSYPTLQIM